MIPRVPRLAAATLVLALLAVAAPAAWAAHEGERIIEVDVRGTHTIAKQTVLAKAQTKPGTPYQDAAISEDIRRLFTLGFFTDVRADVETLPEGLRLIFVVTEKPTISAVDIEGPRSLSLAKLQELLALKKGELYDPRKLKEGVDQIKAEYARRGFSQCEMASQIHTDQAANTVRVTLLIDEGTRLRVQRIYVEGNQAFSDARIRHLLKTKPRWWFLHGVYNEQVLEEDLERVRAFYRKHGYQDVQVDKAVYREASGRGLAVRLNIAEGLQHRVGQVAVDGAVLFPEREIRRAITLKPGSVYSPEALQEDLRLIKQYYGDRGYIHAQVSPDPQLDPTTKRVNLTYHLAERELVAVNRIEIQGNLHTKDEIIRRELRIYPGETFNGARIRKSLDRLYNLGFFEEVSVDTQPTDAKDKEDLLVRVKESKTGSFSFGGGFSSVDRLVGLVELEQRNFDWRNFPSFTGAGEDVRFRVEFGTVRRLFDLSFTQPWIFDHPVSLGVDLYNRRRLRSRDLGLAFQEERVGGGLRLGRELFDRVHLGTSYQLFRTKITDVVEEASADLKTEQGKNTISELGVSLAYDARDNRFDPTRGFYVFTSADLAGGFLGANRDFYRMEGGASLYLPHLGHLVFESRFRTGIVNEFGNSDKVPIFERFFGGGSGTIRGFPERRVGPRDPNSNDPIGGEATFVSTLEEVLTIVKDEHGRAILKGSVFLDAGDVWKQTQDFGNSLKAGVGVGMRVTTPIGPVRLDVGFPVSRLESDEKRKPRFHFNVSRSF